MLILKPFEVCPHAKTCVHNKIGYNMCPGTQSSRNSTFFCKLDPTGKTNQQEFRSSKQKTGNEQLIQE